MRSSVYRVLAISAAVVLLSTGRASADSRRGAVQSPKKRPNVLFILTDDLGYGDLACYGHPQIKTPNIDKLAKEGMRFTQFYVTAPVCTPSRASFMTGRYAQRYNIHHADLPESEPRYPLPDDAVTIQRLLQAAGYRTAHIGKWHLGEPPLTGMPRKYGFDLFFGSMGGRPSSSWTKFARYDDAQYFRNEEPAKTYPGYNTDVLTDQALAYLDDVGKGDRPFYLNLWYNAPHEPLSPKVKQAAMYAGLDKKQQVYYGTVTNLDENIGRLLKKLDDLGIAGDTIVIFTSDNGPEVPTFTFAAGSAGPLRGKKTQLWDGGVRLPFIVRWPGKVAKGSTCTAVASALDFLPTVAELAGVKHPQPKDLEGMSLLPVLTGANQGAKRTLYWEFHWPQRGGPASGSIAIRDGDWKLHIYQDSGKKALYDLKTDIGEKDDVAEQHKDVAAELYQKAMKWYDGIPHEKVLKRTPQPLPKTEKEANTLPGIKQTAPQEQSFLLLRPFNAKHLAEARLDGGKLPVHVGDLGVDVMEGFVGFVDFCLGPRQRGPGLRELQVRLHKLLLDGRSSCVGFIKPAGERRNAPRQDDRAQAEEELAVHGNSSRI
jgi:arylsulfatase A-like enzyme